MKLRTKECVAVLLLAAPIVAGAQDITYNVDDIIGAGSVVGTVTTNGTLGTLKTVQVVAWDLTLTAPNLAGGPSVVLTNSDGTFAQYSKGGLSATATTLSFNYGGTGYGFFFSDSSNFDYWCGASSGASSCNFETDPAETIGPSSTNGDADAQVLSEAGIGEKVIGTVSAVPAPTTLVMLSAGLAALGVVRRQKAV